MTQKKNVKTLVVSLYGSAGVGKSLSARELSVLFQRRGVYTELICEFVKPWAHTGRSIGLYDQAYIFGCQSQMEAQYYGILELLITDSPLLIGGFYEKYLGEEIITPAILNFINLSKKNGVEHLNFWLEDHHVYEPRGRNQNEEESKAVHAQMKDFLLSNGVDLIIAKGIGDDRINFMKEVIVAKLKSINEESN